MYYKPEVIVFNTGKPAKIIVSLPGNLVFEDHWKVKDMKQIAKDIKFIKNKYGREKRREEKNIP